MELSDNAFVLLDALDRREIQNQRQLAQHAGISLGQVNYILKSLLGKGLIKVENFRKSSNKMGYTYLLTPKGIQTKSRLAVRFITSKIEEYESLRNRLTERLVSVETEGHTHMAFVGPQIVKDFIASIIVDKKLNLVLTGYFRDWRDISAVEPGAYDLILLFDDIPGGLSGISETTGIPKDMLVQLW